DEPVESVKMSTQARWRVFHHTVEVCQDIILDYPDVLEYLMKERGLSADTIGKYRLGFMGRGYLDAMKKRGFSLAALREAGLVADDGNAPTRSTRPTIPSLDGHDAGTLSGTQLR